MEIGIVITIKFINFKKPNSLKPKIDHKIGVTIRMKAKKIKSKFLALLTTTFFIDAIKKIDVITKIKLKTTETLIPKIDNLSSNNLPIANSALAENRNNNVMRFLNFILSKNYV